MKLYKDRNWLYQKYWIEKLSSIQMEKLINCGGNTIISWMRKFDIKIRTRGDANNGRIHSLETRIKMQESAKRRGCTEEKLRRLATCNIGRKHSEETKQKMSEMRRKYWNTANNNKKIAGERNHNWKGGITPENKKIRGSPAFTTWRIAVFERDNYTCVRCLMKSGNGTAIYLHAHHILGFADFPEERLEINNGATLCKKCHKYIHSIELKQEDNNVLPGKRIRNATHCLTVGCGIRPTNGGNDRTRDATGGHRNARGLIRGIYGCCSDAEFRTGATSILESDVWWGTTVPAYAV